ncbi:MAG: 16S rRNA processing protein RimM [Clostridia bacterium]|nr:16S rRNA processing protein RimM [Clostridia bacterium]
MAFIEYPECGKIINTHGCRGGVKVEPWCDSPAVFAALPVVYLKENGTYVPRRLQRAAVLSGRFVSAELEGVTTMEQAEVLRGRVLYAKREDLPIPEGVLLVAELIGLPVYHADSGEQLGTLADVIHPGASDIYVINTPRGEAMVPVVPEFVIEVSMEKGIALRPIEGMLP